MFVYSIVYNSKNFKWLKFQVLVKSSMVHSFTRILFTCWTDNVVYSLIIQQIFECIRPFRASLVAQCLRIHLPMQGTLVQALVGEDPTCCGATKPVCRNYWACALEPESHNYWAHVPQLLKLACLEPVLRNKRSHRNEKPAHSKEE